MAQDQDKRIKTLEQALRNAIITMRNHANSLAESTHCDKCKVTSTLLSTTANLLQQDLDGTAPS